MRLLITAAMVASVVAVAGCQSSHQQDIQTALDAIQAARDAARAELPDTALAQGAIGILDVALSTYGQVHADDSGEGALPYYIQWLGLAARAVSAVISILDGSGIDIPEIILEANRTLLRWMN